MTQRIYVDEMSRRLKMRRLLWQVVRAVLFRPTPRFALNGWRVSLLRLFGAEIGKGCRVAPDCDVWAPWNLKMGVYVCLADGVDCYSHARIELGDYSTVSQRGFLCTASHRISSLERPPFSRPITIQPHAWVCAEAFIGPGITIAKGAVVGARAVVTRDVEEWTIVAGNPARRIGVRSVGGDQR